MWHHHFLKSKTKEPPKLLSLSGMRGGKFISVNNSSAQEHASSKNRHSLNFGVMAEDCLCIHHVDAATATDTVVNSASAYCFILTFRTGTTRNIC